MITTDDGTLTYASRVHPLLSWRPDNDILFVISVAFLTTLVSYQATSIILDLCLGLKQRRRAKASDLLLNRLVLCASPLALFRNIFPSKWSQHCDFLVSPPPSSLHSDRRDHVPPKILFKLFFLLAVGPVMNIVAIFFAMEYETELSFSEAGLGGLAVGVNKGLSTLKSFKNDLEDVGAYSAEFPIFTPNYDTVPIRFKLNSDVYAHKYFGEDEEKAYAEVSVAAKYMIINIGSDVGRVYASLSGYVEFLEGPRRKNVYHILPTSNGPALHELHEMAMAEITELCDIKLGEIGESSTSSGDNSTSISNRFDCVMSSDNLEEMKTRMSKVIHKVTLVDTDFLYIGRVVEKDTEGEYFQADDLPFLTRRRNYLSIPILCIALFVLFAIRTVVAILTRNDFDLGTAFVVRNVIGLHWCDTIMSQDGAPP